MTYVGKKELKEQADKWKFCIRQNIQVLLSRQACFRPSIAEVGRSSASAILSFSMRPCASSFSRSLSHQVVRGVFGRKTKPKRATTPVTAPSTMKSLVVV